MGEAKEIKSYDDSGSMEPNQGINFCYVTTS